MSKIESINKFYEWYYNKVQAIHPINDYQFENIIEKL